MGYLKFIKILCVIYSVEFPSIPFIIKNSTWVHFSSACGK